MPKILDFEKAALSGDHKTLLLLCDSLQQERREALLGRNLAKVSGNGHERMAKLILQLMSNYTKMEIHPVFSKLSLNSRSYEKESKKLAQQHLEHCKKNEAHLEPDPELLKLLETLDEVTNLKQKSSPKLHKLFSNTPLLQAKLLTYPSLHVTFVSKLLSRPLGLILFYKLLSQGFDAFVPFDKKGCEMMQHHIYLAGKQFERDIAQMDRPSLEGFFVFTDNLADQCEALREKYSPKTDQYLFHATFIMGFLTRYASSVFRSQYDDNEIHFQNIYLISQLKEKNFSLSPYELARAGGFSFSQTSTRLNILTAFSNGKNEVDCDLQKTFFSFVISRYQDNYQAIFNPALNIVLQCALEFIEKDFNVSAPDINQILSKHYEIYLNEESLEAIRSEALYNKSAFLLQRVFSLILLALYKNGIYEERAFNSLKLFSQELKVIQSYNIEIMIEDSSEFSESLLQLRSCFSQKHIFKKFLVFLNEALQSSFSSHLGHLLELDTEIFLKSPLEFGELQVPNEEAFAVWKKIPKDQRRLLHTMESVLSMLENKGNLQGPWPTYYGYAPKEIAKKDKIYKESKYSLPALFHGENAHRIQIAAMLYFIDKAKIVLPEGKSVYDLLTHILENGLWPKLFDAYDCHNFCSPEFLMNYLRQTPELKALHIYALFRFFYAMDGLLSQHEPQAGLSYESLCFFQAGGLKNYFHNFLPDKPFEKWIASKQIPCEFSDNKGRLFARFFKETAQETRTPQEKSLDLSL